MLLFQRKILGYNEMGQTQTNTSADFTQYGERVDILLPKKNKKFQTFAANFFVSSNLSGKFEAGMKWGQAKTNTSADFTQYGKRVDLTYFIAKEE